MFAGGVAFAVLGTMGAVDMIFLKKVRPALTQESLTMPVAGGDEALVMNAPDLMARFSHFGTER